MALILLDCLCLWVPENLKEVQQGECFKANIYLHL